MKAVLLLLVLLFMLFACETTPSSTKQPISTTSLINYANHFELIKMGEDYLLHILSPESGEITEKYFLTKSHHINRKGYKKVNIPLKRIIPLSSTYIGMLSALNLTETVVGISNHRYIYDSIITARFHKGEIVECGDESTIPVEKIIAKEPQIILYSGFGNEFPSENQLHKLGVFTLPIYEWREKHVLGKAEWIKLIGALTDRLDEAQLYFNTVKSEYLSLKMEAQKLSLSPTVLCGNMIGDIWFAPNGDSYMAELLEDAGANYKYKNTSGTGSIELSLEQVVYDNRETQFWLNPGYSTMTEIKKSTPNVELIGPAIKQQVYCYSRHMNRFWERSAIEPNLILKDLINIFRNNEVPDDSLYFYSKVSNQ